jgi:hypothetical protein
MSESKVDPIRGPLIVLRRDYPYVYPAGEVRAMDIKPSDELVLYARDFYEFVKIAHDCDIGMKTPVRRGWLMFKDNWNNIHMNGFLRERNNPASAVYIDSVGSSEREIRFNLVYGHLDKRGFIHEKKARRKTLRFYTHISGEFRRSADYKGVFQEWASEIETYMNEVVYESYY